MKFATIGKLLWESLIQSFSGKLWKWLVTGSIGALSALLKIGKDYFGTNVFYSICIGIGIILTLFILRFIAFLAINVIKYLHYHYKESIYGDAIILLKDAFAKVHWLRKNRPFGDTEFIEAMTTICNNLKKIFDKKTKSNCSVSIKVPVVGPVSADTTVTNLCRDTPHSLIRDTDKYKMIQHTIVSNTPYQVILANVKRGDKLNFYYLNNDINNTQHYHNTSKDAYPDGKFPYQCELVCPIIPILPNNSNSSDTRNSENSKEQYDIWGFLCVDCDRKNKLDSKYDLAIIQGVADGVFDVILERKLFKTSSNAKEGN